MWKGERVVDDVDMSGRDRSLSRECGLLGSSRVPRWMYDVCMLDLELEERINVDMKLMEKMVGVRVLVELCWTKTRHQR